MTKQLTITSLGPIGDVGSSSFTQKLIEVGIVLAQGTGTQLGTYPGNLTGMAGGTKISLSGSRTSVKIQDAGGLAGSKADVAIWGMSQSLMNTLQTFGIDLQQVKRNLLTVTAGDAVSGMSTAFIGDVVQAFGDYNAQPSVPMRFECQTGASDAVIGIPTTSYPGAADVITIMSAIANLAGWGFVNNGIAPGQILLSNPVFPGAAVEQVKRCAEHAHINYALLPGSSIQQAVVLAIWPRYGFRPTPGGSRYFESHRDGRLPELRAAGRHQRQDALQSQDRLRRPDQRAERHLHQPEPRRAEDTVIHLDHREDRSCAGLFGAAW